MGLSSAAYVPLLLLLVVGFVAEATRHRITVKSFKTKYRIDWWDDGRVEPYRVIFRKFGLKSIYTFEESGSLKTLTVGNTQYTFSPSGEVGDGPQEVQASNTGSRMLLTSGDETLEDVQFLSLIHI